MTTRPVCIDGRTIRARRFCGRRIHEGNRFSRNVAGIWSYPLPRPPPPALVVDHNFTRRRRFHFFLPRRGLFYPLTRVNFIFKLSVRIVRKLRAMITHFMGEARGMTHGLYNSHVGVYVSSTSTRINGDPEDDYS